MTRVKAWVNAFRLRTLPLALSSVFMGSFMAAKAGAFDTKVFALAVTTTIFLQILSNLANDYGDTANGADHEKREGPKRMVQTGDITAQNMRIAIVICSLLSFVSGISLIFIAFGTAKAYVSFLFLLIGLGAIAAAMKYTMGKNPYGYNGLGDIFVLIFFGLVGVAGTYYLFTSNISLEVLLPALSVGFLSSGVLNLNNMRDEKSDKVANKNTLVVKMGLKWAKKYHFVLVLGALLLAIVYLLMTEIGVPSFILALSLPLFVRHLIVVDKARVANDFDPELKKLALSTLLFVVLFGVALILPMYV
ncbi:1,4-dihydroxy-2-naphthoate polyprenyltransferase [Carboxylicivirga marina]|uniref:1,4-dihydroxy-2-naphthoate octaprenyltransferase n=1 Tax=Carboxylicivirga marina TaxID=2800988 RepID=A0ABS1HLJ2_9BACT|nr:1,4-dihydroxy-2-naphthoate polyprenyltransferase [Carboxylicivirga marina]MBK3518501.1 1,4-dihydroxy-2-naphthoate polyprenyltransferase [Carboxylicivirga marina]